MPQLGLVGEVAKLELCLRAARVVHVRRICSSAPVDRIGLGVAAVCLIMAQRVIYFYFIFIHVVFKIKF